MLVAEQKVILGPNDVASRHRARAAIAWCLEIPNYADNLRWLGFTDDDIANGGSDRLVDALVVAGDEDTILARVQEHLDAGATSVALHALDENDPFGLEALGRIAAVLRGA
jgi:hypothetical protein